MGKMFRAIGAVATTLTALVTFGTLGASSVAAAPARAAAPSRPAGTALSCRDLTASKIATAGLFVVGSCDGVRPGSIVNSDVGQCTLNFAFTDQFGNRYMGTAGHCILGQGPIEQDVGERIWAPGLGPIATDANGTPIGRWRYAILQSPKDFSLIQLFDNVQSEAQVCGFGGPTGINRDLTSSPTVLHQFGNGIVIGSVLPGRTMLALGLSDPDQVQAWGVSLPGDSGSPVLTDDGRAVGVLVTLGVDPSGPIGITRLGPQLDLASWRLQRPITLVTAPTL